MVIRATRFDVAGWGVVPLAEGGAVVAIFGQYAGDGGRGAGNFTDVAIKIVGEFGNLPRADMGMIASGQQGGAGGGTHRGGMEPIVGNAALGQFGQGGGVYGAAKSVGVAESGIVGHENDDVGGIFGQPFGVFAPLMF